MPRVLYRGLNPRNMRAFPAEPGALRLLAGTRGEAVGAGKRNTPSGTLWTSDNPRVAATYQNWGGPILLLDEAEPPAEVFDARGAFWNDFFATGNPANRDFYKALKDKSKMSLEVRDVVDPGPEVWSALGGDSPFFEGESAQEWLRRLFTGDNVLLRADPSGRAPAVRWHGTDEAPRFAGGGLVALRNFLARQKRAHPVDMVKLRLEGFDLDTPYLLDPRTPGRNVGRESHVKLYTDPDAPEFLGQMDSSKRNLYYGLQSGAISPEDLVALRAGRTHPRRELPWALQERDMSQAGSALNDWASSSPYESDAYFPVLARKLGSGPKDPALNWETGVAGQSISLWEPEKNLVSLFDPRPEAIGQLWTPRDVDDYSRMINDPEWFAEQERRYEQANEMRALRGELRKTYPRAALPALRAKGLARVGTVMR